MNRIISRQTATLAGLAAVALGLALAAGAALASDNTPLYSTAVGKATYATYCSSCHGVDLRGTAWDARNDGDTDLAAGARCLVKGVDGLTLLVRAE